MIKNDQNFFFKFFMHHLIVYLTILFKQIFYNNHLPIKKENNTFN